MKHAGIHPNAPLIELQDVTIGSLYRPEVPEIEHVQWKIARGEYWIIGGLGGTGKSDLLATAAGLQRPLQGAVCWFGDDIWELKESDLIRERQRVGIVFENGGRLFRNQTVAQNVALPLRYHHDATRHDVDDRLHQLLEITELSSRASALAGTIGLAWQQRAALARALALRPEVLFIDKPTIGAGHWGWWYETLRKLSCGDFWKDFGPVTIVLTTDDFPRWTEQGNRFALLKKKNHWQVLGERPEFAGKSVREFWSEDVHQE